MTDPRFDPLPETSQRAPLLAGEVILGLLERAADADALEGLLLDLAVHPEGFGFASAFVLRWIEDRRDLEGVRSARSFENAPALEDTLRSGGPRREAIAGEQFARWSRGVDRLPAVIDAAWRHAVPAFGRTGEDALPWSGRIGAFALARGIAPHGVFVVACDEPSSEADVLVSLARLQGFARAGFDALARQEHARQHRRHAAAQIEMARALVSAMNLAEMLRLTVRLAASATRSGGSALWLQTPSGPRLEATHGPAGQREAIGRALQTAAHAVMEEARPSLVERSLHDPNLTPEAAAQLEGYTMVPLLAYGRVLGALAVYDRAGSGMRRDGRLPDFEFLASLGDQLALALDQSSRFDALRDAERKLEEQRTWIGRLERLARVGEGTLEALQAARHPVASIRSFARRLQKSMPADDPRRDALDVVLRESERLDALLESKLDGARKESDSLRLESLNASLQEVLQEFGESLVRRRIRLLKRLAPDLPTLLVDGERVRLVMRNILRHALDDVPVGGRVRIESRRVDRHVVVDVAHDGVRRPGDLIERLFSPFALAGDGAETALAIAHRVVRQHGGEIRFRTEADWNSIVSFTLPIAGNEERRQENERRSRRRDRRTGPAARHGNDSRGASGDAPRG